MQMSNRQIRSREFVAGIGQVDPLTTAENFDSSDGNVAIDIEDIVFLEEATPEAGSQNEVVVTIADARADTQIPIDPSPLDHIFSWQKITSGSNTVDIPVCTLSGAVRFVIDLNFGCDRSQYFIGVCEFAESVVHATKRKSLPD